MPKSKQDYADIDNKQRILEAATELFIKNGAHDTSLADIAKKLNISKGTLYYYYSSKADLIFDITDIYMENLSRGLLKWIRGLEKKQSPENILEVVFKTIIEARTRGKLHIYLIHEAINSDNSLKPRIREAYKKWKLMIHEGLTEILDPDKDPDIYSEIVLTMLTGGIIHSILDLEMIPLRKLIEPIIK